MSNCRTCVIALGSLASLVVELFSCLDGAHWQVFVASRYHIQQCAPSRQLSSLVTKVGSEHEAVRVNQRPSENVIPLLLLHSTVLSHVTESAL
jgi:hypothetical protein